MKDYDSTPSDHLCKKEENTDEVRQCIKTKEEVHPTPEDMEDNPLWDGSESELIADDDALIYEEQQTGIKLEYALKYQEVLSCVRLISGYNSKTKNTLIKLSLLLLVATTFFVSYFITHQTASLVFGIISIIVAFCVKFVPEYIMKNTAKEITSDKTMYVEVYPDNLVVGKDGVEREIPMDGTCKFKEFENLFMIFPEEGEMVAIPIRSIEPEFLADIEAIITAGTEPKE